MRRIRSASPREASLPNVARRRRRPRVFSVGEPFAERERAEHPQPEVPLGVGRRADGDVEVLEQDDEAERGDEAEDAGHEQPAGQGRLDRVDGQAGLLVDRRADLDHRGGRAAPVALRRG